MEINLNYTHAEHMGYGRLGVKLAAALEAKGVEVFTHMPPPEGVEYDVAAAEGRKSGTTATACWVAVPTHATGWYDTQQAVMFTMWEAMRLPEAFRENIRHFDTILVPSDQNVELFSQFHPNVKRVLLGVDPADWHYQERTAPTTRFNFLIGGSGARKGTDLAVEAFRKAFPKPKLDGRPIPHLVMKSPRGGGFNGDRITTISGKLTPEEEQDVYADAHCYLQPSRGEGFGMQPLQALAQGCPTILTDAHGHESFAHLGHGIGWTPKKAEYFYYGDAGEWWEPNLDDLIEQMRWVYDNYDEATAKAKVAAEVIAQDFTWSNVADQFLSHVDLSQPYVKGEWFVPTPAKFRIRVVRDMVLDIAGRRLQLKRGVDYYDLADVKLVLAESGDLDVECIADEGVYTDDQIRMFQLRKADGNYCDHCGQREGSGLTKADDLYLAGGDGKGDADLTAWHAGA